MAHAPGRLKRRHEFQAVARGARGHAASVVVQALRIPAEGAAARVGFTVTKKTGTAVVRNRIRRRLREAVRLVAADAAAAGHHYVIVGRAEALRRPFGPLTEDIRSAMGEATRRADRQRGDGNAAQTRGEKVR